MVDDDPNELQIIGAAFGLARVTAAVISLVNRTTSPQTLNVQASNSVFGDGWPGTNKSLVVVYRYGSSGAPALKIAQENSTLSIGQAEFEASRNAAAPRGDPELPQLTVWGAAYGLADVSTAVRGMISTQQSLSLTANNATFGDSWSGVHKSFVMVASYTGQTPFVDIVAENQAYGLKYRPPLQILSGFYGLKDVSAQLQASVSRRALSIQADNAVFGDGWPGVNKQLQVVYQYGNGVPRVINADEKSTLAVDYDGTATAYAPPIDPQALNVIGASYGRADVTEKARALIGAAGLDFTAGNDTFGDSWPGVQKSFSLLYGWGAAPPTRLVVPENSNVAVNNPLGDFDSYDSIAGFLANGDVLKLQTADGSYWIVGSDGAIRAAAVSEADAAAFTVAGVAAGQEGFTLKLADGRFVIVGGQGQMVVGGSPPHRAATIVPSLTPSGSFLLGVRGGAGAPFMGVDSTGAVVSGANYVGDLSSAFTLSFSPTAAGFENHLLTHTGLSGEELAGLDIDPKLRAVIWDLTAGWFLAIGLGSLVMQSQTAQGAVAAVIQANPRAYGAVLALVTAIRNNPQASIGAAVFGFGGTLASEGLLLPVLRIIWNDIGGKWYFYGWVLKTVLTKALKLAGGPAGVAVEAAGIIADFALWAYRTTSDILAYVQSGAADALLAASADHEDAGAAAPARSPLLTVSA